MGREYHYARGVDLEFGFAGDDNKEQAAVRFRFEGGPLDGQMMPWFGFFTEKTTERTLESLRYCGWDTDDLADAPQQIGRNLVQLVLEDDEYKGKVRKRIAWVNRIGGPLVKNAMKDAEKSDFFRRMKGAAMRIDKGLAADTGAKAPPPSPARSNPPDDFEPFPGDDDIPF